MMDDGEFMQQAIEFAKRGVGWVSPNPMVGAVIVLNGEVIGSGYHVKYGEPHAEPNAIASCIRSPVGATLYVTLEPCCHYGKQPPCTDAIIKSGIKRVVVGSNDPNPLVSGNGIKILRQHGIEVKEGVLREQCDKLNEVFFYYIKTKSPFVAMKYAMTMDGKIATRTGASRWVTGETARNHVHHLRHQYSGIMVGVDTVIADDPQLSCRLDNSKNPIRVICDTKLRTPLVSQVVVTARQIPTLIATTCIDDARRAEYIEAGCRFIDIKCHEGHIDLNDLMAQLGDQGVDSILLEGGSTLNYAAIKSGIVNKIYAYISPKLFGGETAKTPIGGLGVEIPDSAVMLKNSHVTRLGEDFLIQSEVDKGVYGNN